MQRLALLLGLGLASFIATSNGIDERSAPLMVQARASDAAPQSRIEGEEALDGAVAGALIGAIASKFDERDVEIKLDRVAIEPASPRDRALDGEGLVRFGGEQEWIAFEFDAMYDTELAVVSSPQLRFGGGDDNGVEVADGSALARDLNTAISSALHEEFPQQPLHWKADRIESGAGKGRFVRVEASGLVDFAREGNALAKVEAIYDRSKGRWVQLDYELGESVPREDAGFAAR